VTYVQVTGGVREHREGIPVFLALDVVFGAVEVIGLPVLLPFLFDGARFVACRAAGRFAFASDGQIFDLPVAVRARLLNAPWG
jgi:hypothetical protein